MKRKLVIAVVTLGLLSMGGLLAFLVYKGYLKMPCLFFQLTGLLCPGCGNTRATMALLRLDFKGMLSYNLLYPLQMLYIAHLYFFCCGNYIRSGRFAYRTKANWLDISCLSLFLLWAIVRNIL